MYISCTHTASQEACCFNTAHVLFYLKYKLQTLNNFKKTWCRMKRSYQESALIQMNNRVINPWPKITNLKESKLCVLTFNVTKEDYEFERKKPNYTVICHHYLKTIYDGGDIIEVCHQLRDAWVFENRLDALNIKDKIMAHEIEVILLQEGDNYYEGYGQKLI